MVHALPTRKTMTEPHPTPVTQTTTQLTSPFTQIARAAWIALVGLTIALFASGIPTSYAKASRLTPEVTAWLAQTGLPASFPPMALISLDIASFAFFGAMALFLFWRRSNDWVALLVALLFVLTAAIYSSPITDA